MYLYTISHYLISPCLCFPDVHLWLQHPNFLTSKFDLHVLLSRGGRDLKDHFQLLTFVLWSGPAGITINIQRQWQYGNIIMVYIYIYTYNIIL